MVAEGHTLIRLLKIVDELYQKEKEVKRNRGRPVHYSELVMLKIFLVMVLKRIKHFKSLPKFLAQNPRLREACGLQSLPDRRTLGRRLKSFSPLALGADSGLGLEADPGGDC